MKALSLWQPFASLVAFGVKTVETRSRATSYRGPLAIHATLMTTSALVATYETEPCDCGGTGHTMLTNAATARATTVAKHGYWPMCGRNSEPSKGAQRLPFGAVVATCTLVDCVPTEAVTWVPDGGIAGERSWGVGDRCAVVVESQRSFGDYSPGRWAWLLDDMTPLDEPIPVRGWQGLWNWPEGDSLVAQARP